MRQVVRGHAGVALVLTVATLTGSGRLPGATSRGHEPRPPGDVGVVSPAKRTRADRCDPLVAAKCLMPFPNDYFTVADHHTETGRRVNIAPDSMPANSSGVHIDPTEWNRNDGFSPGAMIVTLVPGLDLGISGVAPITDIGRSLDPAQPIVLLDARTGERQPFFAELDAQADPPSAKALIIRPARNLAEGRRFVVALRRLEDSSGAEILAERPFQLYRDRIRTSSPTVEARRPHMEEIMRRLRRAGVDRRDLYLAWDFTVASARNLSERVLHIRDDAFASLHGHAPSFTVTSVQDNVDARIFRQVIGTFQVPNYLTGTGEPGSRFHYGPDGLPSRNGDFTASFICNVPRSTTADGNAPVTPARPAVYGHGLLGSNDEVNAGNVHTMANAHNFVFCATKWIGFALEDTLTAGLTLTDFSNFPKLADRVQQGFVNTMFLARLMRTGDGFVSSPAFQAGPAHTPVFTTAEVFYDGNSQGGILGGAATAVSTEWTRAVLGVPGMNYSTLLQRSSDFVPYAAILDVSYPEELDRILIFSIVQMLWDRADSDGYAAHMTDHPYPRTPKHTVLLDEAFGDHQVANITTEVEARTIGALVRRPALAPGRSTDRVPFWAILPIASFPFGGSALVVWDSGTPAPPITNTPPHPPQYGNDPHEDPRATPAAQLQKSDFLRTGGAVTDPCGVGPCLTAP